MIRASRLSPPVRDRPMCPLSAPVIRGGGRRDLGRRNSPTLDGWRGRQDGGVARTPPFGSLPPEVVGLPVVGSRRAESSADDGPDSAGWRGHLDPEENFRAWPDWSPRLEGRGRGDGLGGKRDLVRLGGWSATAPPVDRVFRSDGRFRSSSKAFPMVIGRNCVQLIAPSGVRPRTRVEGNTSPSSHGGSNFRLFGFRVTAYRGARRSNRGALELIASRLTDFAGGSSGILVT